MSPKIKEMTIIGSKEQVLNASAVVELARSAGTAASRRFLKLYHAAEIAIASERPLLSESQIRSEAVLEAFRRSGATILRS